MRSRSFAAVSGIACGVLACGLLGPDPASAFQPLGVSAQVVSGGSDGYVSGGLNPRGDSRVTVELGAGYDGLSSSYLLVVFPACGKDPPTAGRPVMNLREIAEGTAEEPEYYEWQDPGPRWSICAVPNAVVVPPGEKRRVVLEVNFLRLVTENLGPVINGQVYRVPAATYLQAGSAQKLAQLFRDAQASAPVEIGLYYRTDAALRQWHRGTFAEVFGEATANADKAFEDLDYLASAATLPVAVSEYQRTTTVPDEDFDPNRVKFQNTVDAATAQGGGRSGDTVCYRDNDFYAKKGVSATTGERLMSGTYVISGMFSTRWSRDHALHPAFGWRVEARTNEGGGRTLGSTYIPANGRWSIVIPASAGYNGTHLRLLYHSDNAYFRPMSQGRYPYLWRSPDYTNIPNTFDVGQRYQDTDSGVYRGLGEMVDAATQMWVTLANWGGIPPLFNEGPVDAFFPNTWYDCGTHTGRPWSCASLSVTEIWLTAEHGPEAFTIAHELAHQLEKKYWNWDRPAGAGGPHELNGCYPTMLGLALEEGFADFMAAWVGYQNRDVTEGGFGAGRWWLPFDPESRVSPPTCPSGWTSEVWVARTFWDLHDGHRDGDDLMFLQHPGATPAIYLNNGPYDLQAWDMRNYKAIYQRAFPEFLTQINNVFRQNRQ
jgi:hypothetical protein